MIACTTSGGGYTEALSYLEGLADEISLSSVLTAINPILEELWGPPGQGREGRSDPAV